MHKNNFRSTLPGHVRIFTGLCNMDHILVALTPPFIPFLSGHTALNASCCFTQERRSHFSKSTIYLSKKGKHWNRFIFVVWHQKRKAYQLNTQTRACLVTKITFGYLYAVQNDTYNVWRFGLTCNKKKMNQTFTITNIQPKKL